MELYSVDNQIIIVNYNILSLSTTKRCVTSINLFTVHLPGNMIVHLTYDTLGLIYKYGLFNESIDFQKSIYYLENAIKNDQGCYGNERKTFIYYLLVNMYYHGMFGIDEDGKHKKELAKSIWTRGLF